MLKFKNIVGELDGDQSDFLLIEKSAYIAMQTKLEKLEEHFEVMKDDISENECKLKLMDDKINQQLEEINDLIHVNNEFRGEIASLKALNLKMKDLEQDKNCNDKEPKTDDKKEWENVEFIIKRTIEKYQICVCDSSSAGNTIRLLEEKTIALSQKADTAANILKKINEKQESVLLNICELNSKQRFQVYSGYGGGGG